MKGWMELLGGGLWPHVAVSALCSLFGIHYASLTAFVGLMCLLAVSLHNFLAGWLQEGEPDCFCYGNKAALELFECT